MVPGAVTGVGALFASGTYEHACTSFRQIESGISRTSLIAIYVPILASSFSAFTTLFSSFLSSRRSEWAPSSRSSSLSRCRDAVQSK